MRLLKYAAHIFTIALTLPAVTNAAIIEVVKSDITATVIAGIGYFNAEYSKSYSGSTAGFQGLTEYISADIQYGDPDIYTGASNRFQPTAGAAPNIRFDEFSLQDIELKVQPLRFFLDGTGEDSDQAVRDSTYSQINMTLVHRFRLRDGSVTGNVMDVGGFGQDIFNESTVFLRDLTVGENLRAFRGHTFLQDHLYEARVDLSVLCTTCVDDLEETFILRMNSQDSFSVEVPSPAPLGLLALGLIGLAYRNRRLG